MNVWTISGKIRKVSSIDSDGYVELEDEVNRSYCRHLVLTEDSVVAVQIRQVMKEVYEHMSMDKFELAAAGLARVAELRTILMELTGEPVRVITKTYRRIGALGATVNVKIGHP